MPNIRDIKDIHSVSQDLIKQVKQEEEGIRRRKTYSSNLRKFLVEIVILRDKHEFSWPVIVKWLKVNHKITITVNGLKSFYFRNRNSIDIEK